MQIAELMLVLVTTLGLTAVLWRFITIVLLNNKIKVSKRLSVIIFIVCAIFIQMIRMLIPEYNYEGVKFEVVDSFELSGSKTVINGEEMHIHAVYGNYSMPCDMLVKCKKKKPTLIPGIYNGETDVVMLVATESTFKSISSSMLTFIDNDKFFNATNLALKEVSNMGLTKDVIKDTTIVNGKDGGNTYYGTIYNVKETVSEVYEQRIYDIEKKICELEDEIKKLELKENRDNTSNVNILLSVVVIIGAIWLMGLITYVVIVKTNTKNKLALIDTSSAAKIREGVMLESRDIK